MHLKAKHQNGPDGKSKLLLSRRGCGRPRKYVTLFFLCRSP